MSKLPARFTATFIPRILFFQTHSTVQVLSSHHLPRSQPISQTPTDFMAQAKFIPVGEKMLNDLLTKQAAALPFQVLFPGTHSAALPFLPRHQHPAMPCPQLQAKSHSSHAVLSSLRNRLEGLRYRLTSQEKRCRAQNLAKTDHASQKNRDNTHHLSPVAPKTKLTCSSTQLEQHSIQDQRSHQTLEIQAIKTVRLNRKQKQRQGWGTNITKTNSEIRIWTYNHPQTRCLNTTVRTQLSIPRPMWHH